MKGMTKLFFSLTILGHMLLQWSNILGRAELGSLTPPAVFTRHCFFPLPLVSGDDSWTGWAELHFLWGMQTIGKFLYRLKRPRVLRTWNPYVARRMGKGCSKRRPIYYIHTFKILHSTILFLTSFFITNWLNKLTSKVQYTPLCLPRITALKN